ncbi:CCHC-type domain-containing protein [Trichonephila clavipes]|nr:CCHC-type domain-containing protein [Trichonephila clavipes]
MPQEFTRKITPLTNHKTNTQLDRTVNTISILTPAKNLMVVEINISKIPITALCDTGSQATIINEKTYQKLGYPTLNPSQCTFSGIGRDRVESKGYFQNFIRIQDTALPAKIHVVNDETIPLDAIIGMDFLQHTQFTLGRNGIRIFRNVDECKNYDVLRIENFEKNRNWFENNRNLRKRKRLDHEFQLEKSRLENERLKGLTSTPEAKVAPKFEMKDGDIVLFSTLFEGEAKRVSIEKRHWISALLALTSSLLLKRFKLSTEISRQKFVRHQRNPAQSWRDFVFEITGYFEEWLGGLGVNDFEGLKNLMITDQLKRRVPGDVREQFVDNWVKSIITGDLADKLDEYESTRANVKNHSNDTRYRPTNIKFVSDDKGASLQPKDAPFLGKLNYRSSQTREQVEGLSLNVLFVKMCDIWLENARKIQERHHLAMPEVT